MSLHIACAIDARYVRPLGAMLSSLCNHHEGTPITLHLLTGELPPASQSALNQFLATRHITCLPYTITTPQFRNLHLGYDHFSRANFLRLLIPELITGTNRILYLDVDILVRRSLKALYETDLRGHPVAAAPDAYPPTDCQRLGIPVERGYFNSGVLVMDLPAWRHEKIADQALDYLNGHTDQPDRCRYADQDGLNVVLQGRWTPLSEIWNFNIYHCNQPPSRLSPIRRACLTQGPAIVHYADRRKPWMRQYVQPFQQEFLRTAKKHGIGFPGPQSPRALWQWISHQCALHILRLHYHRAGLAFTP